MRLVCPKCGKIMLRPEEDGIWVPTHKEVDSSAICEASGTTFESWPIAG